VQIIVAFYLINLQEFKEQISLGIARDRVIGILLGLCAMWLIFHQLWGTLASVEMKKVFVSNLRWLAEFEGQQSNEAIFFVKLSTQTSTRLEAWRMQSSLNSVPPASRISHYAVKSGSGSHNCECCS
jgi:uncharacterized membrane protein required for colicin V production